MSAFSLHPQLAKDSFAVCELDLCAVRLINDRHYPWLILVPQIAGMKEVIDLSVSQQHTLWTESALVSQVLTHLFTPDKLNIATLGNMVAQLHVHHIVRYKQDVSWPKPVWGQVTAKPYTEEQKETSVQQISDIFNQWRER